MLVTELPYTAASRNCDVPPTKSMWPLVRTTRCTGRPSSATAAPNACHCDGTISESMTVRLSSSTTTPALAWPMPPGRCSQAYTPGASGSSGISGPPSPDGPDRDRPGDGQPPTDLVVPSSSSAVPAVIAGIVEVAQFAGLMRERQAQRQLTVWSRTCQR